MANWIQKANKEIKKDGTEGVFARKAKRRGMKTKTYANEVRRKYKGKTKTPAQLKLLRQAVYAKNLMGFKK